MLNINKIHSDINFRNLQKTDVTEILGIPYTTTIDRLKKGNWTPNDLEKLADYFGRTIAYYFDRDEREASTEEKGIVIPGTTPVIQKTYAQLEQHNIGSDPKMTFYTCPECIQKEEKIRDLRENINDLRRHIDLLESIVGKEGQQKASG